MAKTKTGFLFHPITLHLSIWVLAIFSFLSVNEAILHSSTSEHDRERLILPVNTEKEPIRFQIDSGRPYKISSVAGSL